MTASIPFNRPHRTGREVELVTAALASDHWRGDGPFTRRASALLSARLADLPVLLTTSCTHALELAALLLDLGPGDEVIVPAFTFVSTASAIALRGARVVFADVDPATLNLDPAAAAARVGPRTKAIACVHYAGVACDLDALTGLGVPLIEDNAHGLFGRWRGRPLGTFGALATQSFHDTKNLGCGEGGALAAVMSFRRRGDHVQLWLGGTHPEVGAVAPMFWAGVLARLRDQGVATVATRVSLANPPALRLHAGRGGERHPGGHVGLDEARDDICLLYTSPSPRDRTRSRMPSSA